MLVCACAQVERWLRDCKLVHWPNVGLFLDTFQTAGVEQADPATESAGMDTKKVEENFRV